MLKSMMYVGREGDCKAYGVRDCVMSTIWERRMRLYSKFCDGEGEDE